MRTNSITTDNRPEAGWVLCHDGRLTFTLHDASFLDEAPKRKGWVATFIGRHGTGPGSWTTWTYKEVTS
jgi:hypothetical protein